MINIFFTHYEVPPLAPGYPLTGDEEQCDAPIEVTGDTSSSLWGCPDSGGDLPESTRDFRMISPD